LDQRHEQLDITLRCAARADSLAGRRYSGCPQAPEGATTAKIGEVQGDPLPVLILTVEREPLVTVWLGLERTDLSPVVARQLARFLQAAANRAERR
jgi:hypothetical protein